MADVHHRKPVPNFSIHTPMATTNPNYAGHSRTRTTSSNIFPTAITTNNPDHAHLQQQQQQQRQQYAQAPPLQTHQSSAQPAYLGSARTPSQASYMTTTTTTSSISPSVVTYRADPSDLRRTASSRSGGQPIGYVALMRRQKATVWSDRSQHEDPRLLAQQKAARLRAAQEVSGNTAGRLGTSGSGMAVTKGGVTAKIRHHGKANLAAYTPGDLAGGGVPMRLSATEVEGGDDEDETSLRGSYGTGGGAGASAREANRRSGSGRSSVGSGKSKGLTYRQSGASSIGRWSGNNTPPDDEDETPVPDAHDGSAAKDYFARPGGNGDGTYSAGSGSSGERGDTLGDLGSQEAARLASNRLLKSTLSREKSTKSPEELRRRGSVDERTMTLSTGRLYIANPDADSD